MGIYSFSLSKNGTDLVMVSGDNVSTVNVNTKKVTPINIKIVKKAFDFTIDTEKSDDSYNLFDKLKFANVEYSIQTLALPDLSITGAPLNTPQRNITMAPDMKVSSIELLNTNGQTLEKWIVLNNSSDLKISPKVAQARPISIAKGMP